MVYKLVLANFLLAYLIFLLTYKKCKFPKICFYREALIIGCISSAAGIFLKIYDYVFYLSLAGFSIIFFLSFTGVVLWSFLRDPKREFSGAEDLVISPADGRIIYIRKVDKGSIPVSIKGKSNILLEEIAKTDLFNKDSVIIGITMSLLDVHVNRAPISGEVILQKHAEGKFLSLKLADSDTQNERNIIVMKNQKCLIGIVQIASKRVRRILSFVNEGQNVKRGDKIGKIMFGSQVDVILPANCDLLIKEGMRVYAGSSAIAKIIGIR